MQVVKSNFTVSKMITCQMQRKVAKTALSELSQHAFVKCFKVLILNSKFGKSFSTLHDGKESIV
ncbi:hypothetical protein A3860_15845 [Niastella vici]|uniref:Uncharacterized protein n=1 Tax=Niastella vici TaxID=1703345 RepID=A0A1V9G6F1_9BACT|nr:hypothetical protein A3860_15845 [Niastella vici]